MLQQNIIPGKCSHPETFWYGTMVCSYLTQLQFIIRFRCIMQNISLQCLFWWLWNYSTSKGWNNNIIEDTIGWSWCSWMNDAHRSENTVNSRRNPYMDKPLIIISLTTHKTLSKMALQFCGSMSAENWQMQWSNFLFLSIFWYITTILQEWILFNNWNMWSRYLYNSNIQQRDI